MVQQHSLLELRTEVPNHRDATCCTAADNMLNHTLPAELSSWPHVQNINFGNNRLTGVTSCYVSSSCLALLAERCLLSEGSLCVSVLVCDAGTLHPDWASMSSLKELNLSGNALSGCLPDAWSRLTITTLDLNANALNCARPT